MKPSAASSITRGFTLLELLLIITIILILFVMFAPGTFDRGGRPRVVLCLNNQGQIILAEALWHEDNTNLWLWQVHSTDTSDPDSAPAHFQQLATYLKNPGVLVCPSDVVRKPADTTSSLRGTHLSYFINHSADPQQNSSILTGDRHLELDKLPVHPGITIVTMNQAIRWTKELHSTSKLALGVLGFTDGHVEAVKTDALAKVFQRQNLATNLLAIP